MKKTTGISLSQILLLFQQGSLNLEETEGYIKAHFDRSQVCSNCDERVELIPISCLCPSCNSEQ